MKKNIFLFLLCSSLVSGAVTPEEMHRSGKWELPPKHTKENGFRGETVLNGFWLVSDTKDGAYRECRVPDSGIRNAPLKHFYREVKLPREWMSRNLMLEVDLVSGTVRVNGTVVGKPAGKRFYEYPVAVPPDGILKIEIETGSVVGDVYLRSFPKKEFISDSYIRPSFRKKMIRLNLAAEKLDPKKNYRYFVRISDHADLSAPVKEFSGTGAILESSWKNPRLWSCRTPELYYYGVELRSSDGHVLDRILPRRFGFREVWIENGSLLVNGVPTAICDDVWEGHAERGNVCVPQAREAMKTVKLYGLTGGFRIGSEATFNIADEVGMNLMAGCGSFVKINIWDPKSGLTRMDGDENVDDIKRLVRRRREHPSILAWGSSTAYSLASMHPEFAGQFYDCWNYFPLNRSSSEAYQAQQMFRRLVEMVKKMDPEREIGSANGPYSPLETATRYLCVNLDPQEREEFFDYWFRTQSKRKAIWVSEFGVPFAGHEFLRYIDHQMPQGGMWPKIHLENAARFYGDSVYLDGPDSQFGAWLKERFFRNMAYPVLQRKTAENVRRIWRAWRTYGVNISGHHVLSEGCFGPVRSPLKPEERYGFKTLEDPRCPGFSRILPTSGFPVPGKMPFPPAAQAYIESTAPLLGYIGGGNGHFTRKDHLFFSGHPVEKAFIVINDLVASAEVEGQWCLRTSEGNKVLSGTFSGTVKPGHRAITDFPIHFPAPDVKERTDFLLEVSAGSLKDEFSLTVFPKQKKTKVSFPGKIWYVNISDDRTHETPHFQINRDNAAFLEAAGVVPALPAGFKTFTYCGYGPDAALAGNRKKVISGTPGPGDLLIIPRLNVKPAADGAQGLLRFLHRIHFDQLVENGLRVIFFEQNVPNLLGINMEDVRPRRAFISAKGHPVFHGLKESDLSNWSGSSRLQPSRTPFGAGEERFPERLWHVSNTNSVATRTLIRPQVGAVRALAVSGFDLQESPLLEAVRGKGRILFCQFDVSTRYGTDPAATRLVDNIFRYMTSAAPPDPEKNTVRILPPDGKNVCEKKGVFRMRKPDGFAGWGITQGDLFCRESIYAENKPTPALPDFKLPVFANGVKDGNGVLLPEVIRWDSRTKSFTLTLSPENFKTGWMKRKAAWLKAALLINQNGTSLEGPALKHHGDAIRLYPWEWIEDFVHPYTANIW